MGHFFFAATLLSCGYSYCHSAAVVDDTSAFLQEHKVAAQSFDARVESDERLDKAMTSMRSGIEKIGRGTQLLVEAAEEYMASVRPRSLLGQAQEAEPPPLPETLHNNIPLEDHIIQKMDRMLGTELGGARERPSFNRVMVAAPPLPDAGDLVIDPLQTRQSLGSVAALPAGDSEAAHAPGLWITEAGPQTENDLLWEMSAVDWTAGPTPGPHRWEASDAVERPADSELPGVLAGVDGTAGDDLFVNGWTEASMAAGWYWGDEWAGEWCEVWPCDSAEWMMGPDGMYPNGPDGRGPQQEDGPWQPGGPWEANESQQRWQDRRLDGPRPFRGGLGPRPGAGKWPRPVGRSHVHVPRRLNLEERFRDRASTEEVTTLMIRNVPNRYDRSMLMQELDFLGFQGKYDFLYLPIDNATHWNVGYAFVNFDEPLDAERCMQVLEGHQFLKFRHSKKRVAQVSIAHIQGLEQNLAHCSGTSVFSVPHPWLRPWVRRRPGKPLPDAAKIFDTQRCRTPPGSDCDGQGGEALQQWERGINQLLDEDEPPCSTPEHPAPLPSVEPRLEKSTVELRISSCTNEAVWARVVQHVISSGARRLKLLPSSPISQLMGGGVLPQTVRNTLQAIADLPELATLEVEVAAAEDEAPIILSPKELREHLGLDDRSTSHGNGSEMSCSTSTVFSRPSQGSTGGNSTPTGGYKGGLLRGVSLPPEGARSGGDGRGSSLRSGSLNSWRRAPRNHSSRPARRRGTGASSVGAHRRQGSVARTWGARAGQPNSPRSRVDAHRESRPQEAESWPALGNSVPSAADVVWPQQPPQNPQQKGQLEEAYPAYNQAPWSNTLADGAEVWAGSVGGVAALSDCDIRLCYLCSDDWLENSWDSSAAGDVEVSASCREAPGNENSLPHAWCNASTEDTTSTGDPDTATSPPEGSDVAAHVDSTSCSDICNESDLKACGEPVTTLMIRNIPANYSQDMLFRELEALGLHAACNFVYLPYLPMDSMMPWNIGCAFVNFWTPEDAERARSVLSGHVWEDYVNGTRKVADITDALIQGYDANIQHYNLTAVKDCNWESATTQVNWNWGGSSPGNTCTPDFANMPRSPAPDHIPHACPEDSPKDPPPSAPPKVDARVGRPGCWSLLERVISRTPSPELHHHSCAPHHHLAASSSPQLGPQAMDVPSYPGPGEGPAPGRRRSRSPPRTHCGVVPDHPPLPPVQLPATHLSWSTTPPPPPPVAPQVPADGELAREGEHLPPLPAHSAASLEAQSTPDSGGAASLAAVSAVPRGPRARCAASPGPSASKASPQRPKWTLDGKKEDEEDTDGATGEDRRPLGIEEWPSLGGRPSRRRKLSRCPRPRISRSEIVDATVR